MGRSAKVHKRTPKKSKSSTTGASSSVTNTVTTSQAQVHAAKKKAGLKDKTSKAKGAGKHQKGLGDSSGVLGGTDYVSLMMGGRRKAREEAEKLSRD